MSESPWNDPRITAYVLEELDDAERAAFETEMQSDSNLAAAVEEARSVTGQLIDLYTSEEMPPLDDERREAIRAGEAMPAPSTALPPSSPPAWKVWGTVLAAAAVLLVLVGLAPWLNRHETDLNVSQVFEKPDEPTSDQSLAENEAAADSNSDLRAIESDNEAARGLAVVESGGFVAPTRKLNQLDAVDLEAADPESVTPLIAELATETQAQTLKANDAPFAEEPLSEMADAQAAVSEAPVSTDPDGRGSASTNRSQVAADKLGSVEKIRGQERNQLYSMKVDGEAAGSNGRDESIEPNRYETNAELDAIRSKAQSSKPRSRNVQSRNAPKTDENAPDQLSRGRTAPSQRASAMSVLPDASDITRPTDQKFSDAGISKAGVQSGIAGDGAAKGGRPIRLDRSLDSGSAAGGAMAGGGLGAAGKLLPNRQDGSQNQNGPSSDIAKHESPQSESQGKPAPAAQLGFGSKEASKARRVVGENQGGQANGEQEQAQTLFGGMSLDGAPRNLKRKSIAGSEQDSSQPGSPQPNSRQRGSGQQGSGQQAPMQVADGSAPGGNGSQPGADGFGQGSGGFGGGRLAVPAPAPNQTPAPMAPKPTAPARPATSPEALAAPGYAASPEYARALAESAPKGEARTDLDLAQQALPESQRDAVELYYKQQQSQGQQGRGGQLSQRFAGGARMRFGEESKEAQPAPSSGQGNQKAKIEYVPEGGTITLKGNPKASTRLKKFMSANQAGNQARGNQSVALGVDAKASRSVRRHTALGTTLGRNANEGLELDALSQKVEFDTTEPFGIGPGLAGDRHDVIVENEFKRVSEQETSTFSVDVDTASYSKVRNYLVRSQHLPQPGAVRIEEMVNYFDYGYEGPDADAEHPFAAQTAITSCPWNEKHRLARIALKGKTMRKAERPACNLVFLLDTSGSMNASAKMPLVKQGMRLLLKQLRGKDKVAITAYAGSAGLVIGSTSAKKRDKLEAAIERLRPSGSTNGAQGIALAYQTARENFIEGGVNRVILCTDGDFNVGVTSTDDLTRMVEREAKDGIYLSVLGFGMGNHNDAMLETITGKGNGNYAYIDSEAEAKKVLVDQVGGTLVTIAKNVKLQIEFNPVHVSAYRLIGYENRILAKEDFNDDTKDAGEIGAGHAVTALYELVPADVRAKTIAPKADPPKFQTERELTPAADSDVVMNLKLRYLGPDDIVEEGAESSRVEYPVTDDGSTFDKADDDFRFAAAVASFGMQLRGSQYAGDWTYGDVLDVAEAAKGDDPYGIRAEFTDLVRGAIDLSGQQ